MTDLYRWAFVDQDDPDIENVIRRDLADPPGDYDDRWLAAARALHSDLGHILNRHGFGPDRSCGCRARCGDDGDIDGPGVCKGLPA